MTISRQLFDVAVVGAGPSGATAGYELARRGYRVIVLDKRSLPRDKTCAGGVQARVLGQLPFDVRPTVSLECSGVAFTRRLGAGFVRRADRTLVYQVERAEFDEFLIRQAVAAGAELRDRFPVLDVESSPAGCQLVGEGDRRVRCRNVVWADGVRGIGYRTVNRREHRLLQLAIQWDAPLCSMHGRYDPSLVSVDWGTLPDGYGWVFPKPDRLVIGCVAPKNARTLLGPYLQHLTRRFGITCDACSRLRAWQIPTISSAVRVATARTILVGDAAGCVDPFSGEGIAFAVESGRLAAEAICRADALDGNLEAAYGPLITRHVVAEILTRKKIQAASALATGHVHRLFRDNDRVWECFCAALEGIKTLEQIRRLAPFSPLWPVIDIVAASAYRHRQRNKTRLTVGQLDQLLAEASVAPHPALS